MSFDLKNLVQSNNAFRSQHVQKSEAIAATAQSQQQSAEDSFQSPEEAMAQALSVVLQTLQEGAKPPDDWHAEEMEIEIRLGMIVTGSRRFYQRSEKNKAQLALGEDFRKQGNAVFQAGIDESFARRLRHRLQTSTKDFVAIPQPTEIVYCNASNQPGQQNKRYLLIENENENRKVFREEEKSRKFDLQLAMLPYDYDLRICGAKEKTREREIIVENDSKFTTDNEPFNCDRTRTKKRITFYRKNKARLWRIDFTEVITTPLNHVNGNGSSSGGQDGSKSGEVEYELEFEMEPNVKVEWVNEKNPERLGQMTYELTMSLMNLIKMLIPSHANHAGIKFEKTDLITGNPAHGSVKQQLIQRFNCTMKPNTTMGKFEFLGSMPINLYRKSFKNVQNMDYFLTEKTDGVRYLMYTMEDANLGMQCILCNRDCLLSYFPGGKIITEKLGVGCVFDGEVVFNVSLNRYVFLIFDVLMLDFQSLIEMSFEERLNSLENVLDDSILEELSELIDQETSQKGLLLRRKRYFKKDEITDLINCFQVDTQTAGHGNGERYFTDTSTGKRSHLTDGIIFQPAAKAYEMGRCYDLFKWKWSDMRSVDLGVAIIFHPQKVDEAADTRNDHRIRGKPNDITNQSIHLWCAKGSSERIDCTKRGESNVGLGKFDTYRLLAEYDHRRTFIEKSKPIIAEVCYDIHIGMWSYVKIREDKSTPNAIDAVMGVFTEQAEAIGIEELEFSLLASEWNEEQNYGELLEKCKQEIIKLQRNKKRTRAEG
jgi:hypothetical protein